MSLVLTAFCLLFLTIVISAILLGLLLNGLRLPRKFIFLFGMLGAFAIGIMFGYSAVHSNAALMASTGLLTLACIGGLVLYMRYIHHVPVPKWLAILDEIGVLVGFALMLGFTV